MKILTSFLTWFRTNRLLGACLSVLLVSGLLHVQSCNDRQSLKKQIAVQNHNIEALTDTIRVTKDREGKAEFDKLALLTTSVKKLSEMNEELAAEIKTIKGNVNTIIKSDIKLVEKPVPFVVKGELVDSTVRADFNYDTTYSPGNYRKLSGYTTYNLRNGVAGGQKLTDELGLSFKTGIKNLDKGKPEIFLSSDYPGFQVTALDGAVLDPKLFSKKKRTPLFTIGAHLGYAPFNYDAIAKKFEFKPGNFSGSVGLNINLLRKK